MASFAGSRNRIKHPTQLPRVRIVRFHAPAYAHLTTVDASDDHAVVVKRRARNAEALLPGLHLHGPEHFPGALIERHQPGIDLLLKVVPVDNILFGSEMVGAVRGIDPRSGHYYDDTKRYIEASSASAADKSKLFEGNARRVYISF